MKRDVFEIQVGMPVFLEPTGNNRIRRQEKEVRKGTIAKIGRTYFYVTLDGSTRETQKFSLETFESFCRDCNAGWILYPSEKAYWEKELAFAQYCAAKYIFERWSEISQKGIAQIYQILFDECLIGKEYQEKVKEVKSRLELLSD